MALNTIIDNCFKFNSTYKRQIYVYVVATASYPYQTVQVQKINITSPPDICALLSSLISLIMSDVTFKSCVIMIHWCVINLAYITAIIFRNKDYAGIKISTQASAIKTSHVPAMIICVLCSILIKSFSNSCKYH